MPVSNSIDLLSLYLKSGEKRPPTIKSTFSMTSWDGWIVLTWPLSSVDNATSNKKRKRRKNWRWCCWWLDFVPCRFLSSLFFMTRLHRKGPSVVASLPSLKKVWKTFKCKPKRATAEAGSYPNRPTAAGNRCIWSKWKAKNEDKISWIFYIHIQVDPHACNQRRPRIFIREEPTYNFLTKLEADSKFP